MDPHRKRIQHFHEPGDFHELTFLCYQRSPLLTDALWRRLLCQSIDRAVSSHQFALVAFVLMPEHVHLLVYPRCQPDQALPAENGRQGRPSRLHSTPSQPTAVAISRLLADIKRPFSGRIKRLLVEQHSPLLSRLIVTERPGKEVFRFWQEGPGYDRNLSSEIAVLTAIDYIHRNPVRRGLVGTAAEWKWSSVRWYASDRHEVDPDLPTIHGAPPDLFD